MFRTVLKEKGYTQTSFAAALKQKHSKVSQPKISRICNGEENPDVALALDIERLLDIPVTYWDKREKENGR